MASDSEQLAEAKQRIEELEEAARTARHELQFFVYAAGHDLQQPLRAIGTHAQLIQREHPRDNRTQEFAGVILEGVSQMNALLADLLTYSRTGNSIEATPVNLKASLQWALLNLAKAIESSGAEVTSGELPEVLADEKQMVAVFENLLSNAIKFRGDARPRVDIRGEIADGFHTISVEDNGCGIKPEYHEKIFEPFKRLHGREIPGSGLGLTLCRKIIRAHSGKIWVESDGMAGTVARFTVPIN